MNNDRARWIEEQVIEWLGDNAFKHELANAGHLGKLLRDAMAFADAHREASGVVDNQPLTG